eukprot:g7.t1
MENFRVLVEASSPPRDHRRLQVKVRMPETLLLAGLRGALPRAASAAARCARSGRAAARGRGGDWARRRWYGGSSPRRSDGGVESVGDTAASESVGDTAASEWRARPQPTELPPASRQIKLARNAKSKLEECGAERLASLTLTDWDAFFVDTGLAEDVHEPKDAAQLTLMLSYPLTLAWLLQEQQRAALGPLSPDLSPTASIERKIQVVGARAESSLPGWIWTLVANLTGTVHLDVELIGPMVPRPRMPQKHENATVSFFGKTVYHTALSKETICSEGVDAFFCFHPGWGQDEWKGSWQPTMDALFAAEAPIYFTSFDTHDSQADCAFARQRLRQLVKVDDGDTIVLRRHKRSLWSGENPFRSQALIPLVGDANVAGSDSERLIAVNSKVSMIASRGIK